MNFCKSSPTCPITFSDIAYILQVTQFVDNSSSRIADKSLLLYLTSRTKISDVASFSYLIMLPSSKNFCELQVYVQP